MPTTPVPSEHPTLPILLACARPSLSDTEAAQVYDLLQEPLDWLHLLEAGMHHGLTALLFTHLQAPALRPLVPDDAWQILSRQATLVQQRNLALTAILLEVTGALEARGIRVLSIKGPTLVQEAYGNLGLRPFNDLDLLVARREMRAAGRVLEELGFEAQIQRSPDVEKARCFARGLALIELHPSMSSQSFPWGTADLESYWPRRAACSLGGRSIDMLGPYDLMLYLLVHGGRHRWSCLKWLADVAAFHHRHPDFDWSVPLAEARDRRLLTPVLLAWQLLHTSLGMPLPAPLAEALAQYPVPATLIRHCTALWIAPSPHDVSARPRFLLSLLGSWRARARLLYFILFVPNEEDRAHLSFLPAGTPLVFSLYRPLRLATQYGHRLFRTSSRS